MKAIFRGLSISASILALTACSTPNPTPLDKPTDVPAAFTAPVVKDAPIWPTADWWVNFKADELPGLEKAAQAQNLDIAQAQAQVLESEASVETSFAGLLPTISGSASGTRRGDNGGGPPGTNASNSSAASLSGSFALDIWGLNQDKLRQARETLRGTRYAQESTGLSVTANVANEYFTILSLRERITLTREQIDAAKRILTVVQLKVTNGVSSQLDLASEQATVAGQQASLPSLIEQEREARYALAILLGQAPEGFDIKGQSLNGIVSPTVQPGLPSEVLLRRPDVAQSEASLNALHANLDATRAAFFPSIGLTGSAGWSGSAAVALFNPAGFAWSIGASLAQTIFDGGRLAAANDSAKQAQNAAIASYRETVFKAFSAVETALGQVSEYNDQLVYVTEELRASTEEFRISNLEYNEGTIDILSLLTAQNQLFSAENTLATTKLSRLEANVSLYQQLGGGWDQKSDDAAYTPQLDWWPL